MAANTSRTSKWLSTEQQGGVSGVGLCAGGMDTPGEGQLRGSLDGILSLVTETCFS